MLLKNASTEIALPTIPVESDIPEARPSGLWLALYVIDDDWDDFDFDPADCGLPAQPKLEAFS